MEVEFANKKIEKILTDEASKLKFPINVIKSARRKLILLDSAVDERDLRNLKSLHYEKLTGDMDGLRSVRINDQWRFVFELDASSGRSKIVNLRIEDYH
jgi:toxin HigB-1